MFRDRTAAGERLAAMLEQYRGSHVLVLAIPAGGVPVAAAIARSLGLALEVAPVSKVLFPWTTESGYGAVAFDGSVWIDDAMAARAHLTREQMEKGIAEARAKVERRNARLRRARPLPNLATRAVILVDDGIAAGSTMRAAIAALRELGAAKVLVAVPTASRSAAQTVGGLADAVYC